MVERRKGKMTTYHHFSHQQTAYRIPAPVSQTAPPQRHCVQFSPTLFSHENREPHSARQPLFVASRARLLLALRPRETPFGGELPRRERLRPRDCQIGHHSPGLVCRLPVLAG